MDYQYGELEQIFFRYGEAKAILHRYAVPVSTGPTKALPTGE